MRLGAGLQPLQPMVAEVEQGIDAHDPPRLRRAAPGHARDQAVPLRKPLQDVPCAGRDGCLLGAFHDRRERAVDVTEDGGALRSIAQRSEQALGRGHAGRRRHAALVSPTMSGQSPSKSGPRLWRLAFIATAAGAFSGLFGVGGGTVIVPLLVLWFGYSEHVATGTSLGAIVLIGLFAAIAQATYGNVDLAKGFLVGVPAVAGVIAGTASSSACPVGRCRCCSQLCSWPSRSSC